MTNTTKRKRGIACARALLAASAFAAGLGAQETHRLAGERVAIYNLAGRIDVVAGTGPDVVVRLTRSGGDGGRLEVQTGPIGDRSTLRVVYPGHDVVYRPAGRAGRGRFRSEVRVRPNGTFGDGDRGGREGGRVTIQEGGGGLEAWADLRVEVPSGRAVEVHAAVGAAEVRSVQGDFRVSLGSGPVNASGVRGSLDVEAGSGAVSVVDVDGELSIDTGSGAVDVERVKGPSVSIDTGSGSIEGAEITSPSVHLDTGSGEIRMTGVSAPRLSLDTGSGSVHVELRSRIEELTVDTGSGSVTLYLPAGVGAEIVAETGSGGIDVDLPVQIRSVKRDRLEGRIGDGRGRISIETGSGGIRLLAAR